MQTSLSPSVCRAFLGYQIEKAVDELNLSKKDHLLLPIELALIVKKVVRRAELLNAFELDCHAVSRLWKISGWDKQLKVSGVVLQVSNADKFVAERLTCVLRLPNRKGCR